MVVRRLRRFADSAESAQCIGLGSTTEDPGVRRGERLTVGRPPRTSTGHVRVAASRICSVLTQLSAAASPRKGVSLGAPRATRRVRLLLRLLHLFMVHGTRWRAPIMTASALWDWAQAQFAEGLRATASSASCLAKRRSRSSKWLPNQLAYSLIALSSLAALLRRAA